MKDFMNLAFKLAKKAKPYPNPKVGAVLVRNEKIIGTGYHKGPGSPHAEIIAIENAKANGEEISGSILYVTLEPCSHTLKRTPPCTQAIISSGIKKVVFAMKDPNPLVNGTSELKKAGIEVVGPVNQQEGIELNKRYLKQISKKPTVILKMAMSADGKTATKTGDSKWITNEKSRTIVHKMRGEYDGVMVGAGTVIADNPELTVRLVPGKNPYRIIIDGKLRIPLDSKVITNPDKKTIVITTSKPPPELLEEFRKKTQVWICGEDEVDLQKLIIALQAMGMKKIMIEGGSELAASALNAGVVDQFYFFIAPKIIGGIGAKSVIGGGGIEKMSEAIPLKNMKIKKIDGNILLYFTR